MKIISRSEWGAKPWRNGYSTRPISRVSWFLVHYHGGPPPAQVGTWVPRNIEAIHLANGWSGVGYHFMVDQAGTIYEGRGWDKVGAHSPPHNTDGIGVYVAIGGDQEPTAAALRSVRWLYDEACRRAGRTLRKSWHGYDYATACPGPHLIAWVKAGMPVDTPATGSNTPTPTTTDGDLSMSDIKKILDRLDELEDRLPQRIADYRVPLSDADRTALGGSKLKSISLAGLLKTGVRLQARQTTADAVLREVRE